MTTTNGLFRALDREWQSLCTSRGTRQQLRAWRTDPDLGVHPSVDALIAVVRAGARDPERTDRILAALARRAEADDLAARTLLQAVLPGLWNVAKRLGRGHVSDELEADVLAEAAVRIRTYPIERRPRAIAANITWDVFGAIARRRTRDVPLATVPDPPDRPAEASDDPSGEVVALVSDALDRGRLRQRDAQLLLAIAVGADTIRTRAEREGTTYAAMCERWCRARHRLRLAVAA